MLSNLAIAALAAAGAVNAGPLQRRQTEVASSAVSSAASSVISSVSSAVESLSSGATSVASGASSTAAEATSGASSAASSAAATSTDGSGSTGGNETYPAYPCPAGFLLTYAAVNQTLPVPVTQVTQAAGEWATSPLFPNVTDAMGGNEPGATHTINVGPIALPEVLVSVDANMTSGSAIWTWNGSLPQPVTAMGVSLSNYSTVIQIYDPDYTTTGMIGNTTFVNLFTNACATPQAAAMELLMTLGGLELGNLVAAVSGNSTSGGAMSSMAMGSSMAMSSSMDMSSSMASGAEGATSSAASGAASATSAAGSAVDSVTSAPASAASAATGAAGSVVSSAAAAATSAA